MFRYVLAIATAVSISICSAPTKAEQVEKRPIAKAMAPALPRVAEESVNVTEPAGTAAGSGPFELSLDLQRAMRRALFKSVEFLD